LVDGRAGSIVLKIDYDAKPYNGELIVQSVTCFCDIDISQLSPIHTRKYGFFGVGVDRQLVAEMGGRPVSYIPIVRRNPSCTWNSFGKVAMTASRALRHHFEGEARGTQTHIVGRFPETPSEAARDALTLIDKELLAFMKFFDIALPDDHPENFYMEREWRKFGSLGLELTLRKIIVGMGYGERLAKRFPQHANLIVEIS
jgi:hypothetical protein